MLKIRILICQLFLLTAINADGVLDLLQNYGWRMSYNIKTEPLPTQEEYDFIVVGSGSGGSVVANRLSENKKWKILLLEAGMPEGVFNQIPMLYANMLLTDYNWGYRLQRQKNGVCSGFVDRRCNWPRGKSLGGTSSINGMLHNRGNRRDFDIWESLGNNGWSYDNVLPYFKKSENFRVSGPHNSSYHGHKGPLCVQDVPYEPKLAKEFLEAGKELGFDIIDYNGPTQIGFSLIHTNMDHGSRCSASKAYLSGQRRNLDIVTHAFVTKILIDDNNQAYGVQYVKNGITRMVRAKKEVILSAGTIDSAKLLMLSGIGPRDHLQKMGIEVIVDAKVGYNMHEHVGFFGLVFTCNSTTPFTAATILSPANAAQYFKSREGPFSSAIGVSAISFFQTKYAVDDRPDIELLFFNGGLHSDNGLGIKPAYGVNDEVYNKVFKPLEFRHAWSVWPIVQNPRSVGRVKLRSKNPYHQPIMHGNLLTDPHDVEVILEGVKAAIKLSQTKSFQKYDSKIHSIKIPGCESFTFGSDDYFRCAIKALPALEHHQIGTVKMGPPTDPNAVVDSQLRVYGIQGLRVVDASIMPTMPVGHINANVYMIGEKASDMIKEAWRD